MGGQAFNGTRGKYFYCDPDRVSIIGCAGREGSGPYDTPHGEGDHTLFDARVSLPVEVAMVNNIRTYGLIETVKVRKAGKYPEGHPLEGEDIIEVIDGRQRTRACRLASRAAESAGEVPPQLKIEFQKTDEEGLFGIMISANEQRADDSLPIKAQKAARILSLGHDETKVAVMFGVGVPTIRRWVQFVELAPNTKKAVTKGKISFSAALALGGLSPEEQTAKLGSLLVAAPNGKAPTVEAAQQAVKPKTRAKASAILPKSKVKKLVADEEFTQGLSADAHAILKVFLGDSQAIYDVPGLVDRMEV